MSASLIGNLYRRILPSDLRQKLWRLRHDRLARARADRAVRRHVRCNVCQGQQIVPFHNRRIRRIPFNFYLCQQCNFIFVYPTTDPVAHYSELNISELGEGEVIWNTHYLEAINKYSAAKGRLLEIGFGNGSFLKLAQKEGWDVHGVDLSSPNVRHAREVLELPNIFQGTIADLDYGDDYFDVVAAFNFIEHVADQRGTLAHIRRLVRPNGLVILLCPNTSGIYHLLVGDIFSESDALDISWIPPDHVGYFDKRNLKLLLESTGFKVIGDESHRTASLWRQHELTIGPSVTDQKRDDLLAEIKSSALTEENARLAAYRERIKSLVLEKMTWTMVSELMQIEPVLGSENAILFVSQKNGNE